jgi:hypothetical protein
MEHAEEADVGSEMSGIAGDLKQGLGTGVKQQVIEHLLVLQASGASSRGSVKTAWT